MPTGLGVSLGLGGGRAATSSGASGGGAAPPAPFSNDYSLAFDGTGDRVSVGNLDDMGGIGTLTISVWVYPVADGNMPLSGNTTINNGVFIQTYGGTLYFGVGTSAWVSRTDAGIGNMMTLDTWNHVCCVWNKAWPTPRGIFYVD